MENPQIKIHLGITFDLEKSFAEISETYERLRKSEVLTQNLVHQIPKDGTLEEYYQISITLKEKWMNAFNLEEVLNTLLGEIDYDALIDISNRFNGDTVLYIAASPNAEIYPSLSISSNQIKRLVKFNNFSLDVEVYDK